MSSPFNAVTLTAACGDTSKDLHLNSSSISNTETHGERAEAFLPTSSAPDSRADGGELNGAIPGAHGEQQEEPKAQNSSSNASYYYQCLVQKFARCYGFFLGMNEDRVGKTSLKGEYLEKLSELRFTDLANYNITEGDSVEYEATDPDYMRPWEVRLVQNLDLVTIEYKDFRARIREADVYFKLTKLKLKVTDAYELSPFDEPTTAKIFKEFHNHRFFLQLHFNKLIEVREAYYQDIYHGNPVSAFWW